ncbi:hypothetical protein ROZALSC1DRAFT_15342 [Rozella allomycis CSF55]|uniref:Photolyase/cryptochrome alpha/beta domain-containing protein n=1 Tax=Rozella allomycis (strain CSF55) TaxID=988480 RepID=A0A4P9YFS4_ROZAC|nr:hypothetical protein ROZALSC1DRAFT_15342 [Rozella allomycis CSF55]
MERHPSVKTVSYERDYDPYSIKRDKELEDFFNEADINVRTFGTHVLYEPTQVLEKNGGVAPLTYQGFLKVVNKLGKPGFPIPPPTKLPGFFDLQKILNCNEGIEFAGPNKTFDVPAIQELGFETPLYRSPHHGGESVALQMLDKYFLDKTKVLTFEKPNTSPAAFDPASTTVLSPYVKYGCLSVRLFYQRLMDIYRNQSHSKPPVSLEGQLFWREFYYTAGYATPNFHRMEGNPICLQTNWRLKEKDDVDEEASKHLEAWRDGTTGFPWIDAIMNQLRQEGWIHHLARHSVACFLTRGDLYISWERGAEIFEYLLLDADYFLNFGNWLWLSASAFFHQYFRVYSPIAFPKKYDPEGNFVRKYVPQLSQFPKKYIYEPWKAPLEVQRKANCIIGKDYPKPIVEHDVIV